MARASAGLSRASARVAPSGGQKLSKTMASEGAVRLTDIAPIVLRANSASDPIRYYLLRETALGNDGDFSHEGILARYNTDLANNLATSSRA